MALPSSGALSFSAIATEFGGTAPHSMSEYYPLVGLGVSGLPSSGTFNFSQFHGKSNQVTASVWVTSGYNQASSSSAWVYSHQTAPASGGTYWAAGVALVTGFTINGTLYPTTATTLTQGNKQYRRAGLATSSPGFIGYYVGHYNYVTTTTNTWIDTSAYQNQTTTVGI